MSRHPHSTFSSWENGRPFQATYSNAGPSTYAQQPQPQQHHRHQPSWSNNSNNAAAGPSSQPIGHAQSNHHNDSNQEKEQAMPTPTTIITADSTTVYAATGRKRKRLQKACVACHKAKRRCDGGLPCSNCDFSGRTCCYSDANGKMVLPTARAGPNATGSGSSNASANAISNATFAPTCVVPGTPSEVANVHLVRGPPPPPQTQPQDYSLPESRSNPAMGSRPSYSNAVHHDVAPAMQARGPGKGQTSQTFASASPSESPKMGPVSHFGSIAPASALGGDALSDVPPERRRELISIFFSQLHPFSSVIDEISFLRDLSTSEVSPALLFSMYALAARFQQDVDEQRRFAAGEAYARSARAMLAEEDGNGCSALEQPSLDTATTLCLLAAHEAGMGRLQRALSYSSASVRMVIALKFHEGAIPEARHLSYSRDSFSGNIRRNSCQWLVCISWALDILIASLAGQAPSVRADEIDACLASFRAGNSDDVSKAFFSMTQIFAVFVRVLDHARAMRLQQQQQPATGGHYGKGLDKAALVRARDGVRRCEESLHAWAEQLTSEEMFDEANLNSTSKALAEMNSSPSAAKAGCWAMMHMVAESLMFVLHTSTPMDDDQSRQLAAYNNLLLILDSFGAAGRQSLFAFPALLICTEYPTRPKLSVSRWWNQARECWGLSEVQIGMAATSLCISRQSSSPALSLPLLQPSSHSRNGDDRHHQQHQHQQHLPRHHASAFGSMLPSLGSLPLPALRLSPPSSSSNRGSRSETQDRPSLSPIGLISSPTDLVSWRSSNPQFRGSPTSTTVTIEQEGGKSPTQTTSFELYASQPCRSPPSGAIRGATLGANSSDPRSAWSPISSLRGEKRSINSVSQ